MCCSHASSRACAQINVQPKLPVSLLPISSVHANPLISPLARVKTRKGSPFEDEEGDGLAGKGERKLGLLQNSRGGGDLCELRGFF